ncbi:putative ribosome biogenesis protein brx1 protein [Neofusicoccum parvum]|uniref:Putative ribosome biogenesis protein brx1 protein n=1 Tax=Botryosphaeria parva (strain UCR-NP2) TaxID=1287680 RepID=R1EDX4_BOTPV|nr:putative ribosome biogenesis protein brx1 protein [Neofusicoccum parvum UCRNP2]GME53481.1 putative ribosome biogenesis protein brx1 protein [Neofusicoccum parvum]
MAAVYKSLAKASGKDEEAGGKQKIRNKVLILSSRGVTFRHRHLMNDLQALIPHSRKDAKLDTKTKLYQLNEIAELYNCNNIFFFEARKGKDLYAWLSKPPNGPTVKFHLQNLHTMEELHFTGNCLKGSRPILSFDANFDKQAHFRVIKELLLHTFSVPKGARKTKPFVDHVMSFTVADGKIWVRCYQINETEASKKKPGEEGEMDVDETPKKGKGKEETNVALVEIGPRFVMTPIIIQESSFGGPILYENKEFVSPNQVRRELLLSKAAKHNFRAETKLDWKNKRGDLGLASQGGRKREQDPLDDKTLFA